MRKHAWHPCHACFRISSSGLRSARSVELRLKIIGKSINKSNIKIYISTALDKAKNKCFPKGGNTKMENHERNIPHRIF
jgi:hypothetical protein